MEFFIPIRNRHTAAAPGTFGICGNSGDTVRFDFDAEWDPYPEKTAFFFWDTPQTHAETAVLFQGTRCPVPVITQAVRVGIRISAGALRTAAVYIPYRISVTDLAAAEAYPEQDVYCMMLSLLMHQQPQRLCSGRYLVTDADDYLTTDAGDYLMTKE